MIVWRGWGILAPGIIAVGLGLGSLLGQVFGGGDNTTLFCLALGLVAGGVGAYFAGMEMNVKRVPARVEKHMAQRSAQVRQAVAMGTYVLPNGQRPGSLADAQRMADAQLAVEAEAAAKALRNRHDIFFIPMQYIGIVAAIGGVVGAIASLLA